MRLFNAVPALLVVGLAAAPAQSCAGERSDDDHHGADPSRGGFAKSIPEHHWRFVAETCIACHEIDTHFFVHANYAADVPLDDQPDYLLFWEHLHFHLPAPHENGKIAIVGHTAQKSAEIVDLGHVVCLDTYCHGGGWLTALEIGSGQIWQVDRHGKRRLNDQ